MKGKRGPRPEPKKDRFSFRVVTDSVKNVFSFADTHFGAPYWIQIEETEPELIQE